METLKSTTRRLTKVRAALTRRTLLVSIGAAAVATGQGSRASGSCSPDPSAAGCETILPVTWIPQPADQPYCGPACAAMALDWNCIRDLKQSDLYTNQCHDVNEPTPTTDSEVNTTPGGLKKTLAAWSGGAVSPDIVTVDSVQWFVLGRKIVWSVLAHQAPVIFLGQGGFHWMIATGFALSPDSAPPTSVTDQTPVIDAIALHNPWASKLPPDYPQQHEIAGPIHWYYNILVAPIKSEYSSLYDESSIPCHCENRYLMLADNEGIGASWSDERPPDPFTGQLKESENAKTDALISFVDNNKSFLKCGSFENAAQQMLQSVWNAAAPVKVQSLLYPDVLFYLVPFVDGAGNIPLLVLVDAHAVVSGAAAFQGALVVDSGSTYFASAALLYNPKAEGRDDGLGNATLDQWLKLFPAGGFQKDQNTFLPFSAGTVDDTLYWKPSDASRTFYIPFYKWSISGTAVFVRIDGAVYFDDLPSERPG